MSENLPSPRRQTHHHSNIHASFSASAFSFFFSFLAFLISFTFYSVFYGLQFLPIFLLNYSYSLSVPSFPSLLHLLWDNVLRVILRFFDSMSLLSKKKRKFRRRERTMPGGHGAVQSAEVGVMQIWFSFNIKNGGFLIRWLSFFRLTDALLTC